jgi:hypothetical protein
MHIYNNLLSSFKSSYMLMMPLSIILQSCLGSIATLYIVMNKGPFMILKLAIVITLTMIYNASILAQLKKDIVFKLLIISVLISILILVTV